MKIYSRLLTGLWLIMLSLPTWAADSIDMTTISAAATRSTDLSRQLLVMVFGDVVNNPLHPASISMIGQLYFVFNAVIAALAFFWFCAVTGRQLVRSGHRGAVFSTGHTMMAPIATLAGFISLIPTATGWSLAQLVFLWAASVMGVGSANILTDKAADLILAGQSLTVQPVAPQNVSVARAIFEMNLCRASINAELNQMYQRSGTGGTAMMTIKPTAQGFEIGNGSALCGSARLPQISSSGYTDNFLFSVPVDVNGIQMAQQNALNQMQNQLADDADGFVNAIINLQNTGSGTIPDAESAIQAAARASEDMLTQAARSQNSANQLETTMNAQLKSQGWLALGSWYQTFATANNKTSDAVKMQPVVTGPSSLGEVGVGDFYTEVNTAYRSQLQNTTYASPLGTVSSKDGSQTADINSPTAAFVSVFAKPMQSLTNMIATNNIGSANGPNSNQTNPLLKMKAIGDYTLGVAEGTYGLFVAAKVIASWSKGGSFWAKGINAFSGAADIADGVLEAIQAPLYCLLFLMFSAGFTLSIYLPMIPFIFWISAATTWLVAVLVGTTAGPLWAATHIGTEEDKGSRSAYGYIFLLDVSTRPPLMVFGFFFASLIVTAVGTLVNYLFAPAIANAQASSMTGIVSIVGLLMVYARVNTTLVSRAFSLQVTMPDYVISWLGGREGINMLSGMAESVQNMFVGFGRGAGNAPGTRKIAPNNTGNENPDGMK